MKSIQVELAQVGTDIITQNSVKIRVGGQFVKNSLVDIINNSIDNIVKDVKVEARYYDNNQLLIDVIFLSGNKKRFMVDKPLGFIVDNYTYVVNIRSVNTKDVLQDSLVQIRDAILEIEKYIIQNHSVCNNYFFSV